MDYKGEWGGGGPGHSWALKWHERSECHLGPGVSIRYIKLFTGVNDTTDNFFAGVNDTGNKTVLTVSACLDLKM
jgi:hypothetical protein